MLNLLEKTSYTTKLPIIWYLKTVAQLKHWHIDKLNDLN